MKWNIIVLANMNNALRNNDMTSYYYWREMFN